MSETTLTLSQARQELNGYLQRKIAYYEEARRRAYDSSWSDFAEEKGYLVWYRAYARRLRDIDESGISTSEHYLQRMIDLVGEVEWDEDYKSPWKEKQNLKEFLERLAGQEPKE